MSCPRYLSAHLSCSKTPLEGVSPVRRKLGSSYLIPPLRTRAQGIP